MSEQLDDEKLRYPTGRFQFQAEVAEENRPAYIGLISSFPRRFRSAVESLSEAQLDTPYRPGGWTIRQVVHHVADSHMNAFIRFKWTLTEDNPTIKAYDEKAWAQLPDTAETPVSVTLDLLQALHARWAVLLDAIQPDDWSRTFVHPQTQRQMSLSMLVALYAWHGDHHLGHVRLVSEAGWQ